MDSQQKIDELEERFKTIGTKFDPDQKQTEYRELETQTMKPGFWDDPQSAQKITKKMADIQKDIETFNSLKNELAEIDGLLGLSQDDPKMASDVEKEIKTIEKKLEDLEVKM